MSPIIRTRAQNRRRSGVLLPPTPPGAPGGEELQPLVTRSSNIKKIARRKAFKVEVLADRTSGLNVAQQKKRRRMTSFHSEIAPLLNEATPVGEFKEAHSTQTNEKRRRRDARMSPRTSLHVHWAENLRRVAPISPSPNTAVIQRVQGEQSGGRPRSILRVFRDEPLVTLPPIIIPPAGTSSSVLGGTPLYALPEVPHGITLRRRVRDSWAGPRSSSSRPRSLSIEGSPSSLGSAIFGGPFAADIEQARYTTRVSRKSALGKESRFTQAPPSGFRQATVMTGMMSSTADGRATVSGTPALLNSSVSIRPTRTKARRVTGSTNDRAPKPAPLPVETPVVRHQGWIKLPENRIDRWITIFYLVYTPIILPLVLRVLDLV